MEAQNGALDGLKTSGRRFPSLMRIRIRIKVKVWIRFRIEVKSWIQIRIQVMRNLSSNGHLFNRYPTRSV
jgi:hypothetical protein